MVVALPLGPFRSVFLEIDAFHRERRIPVRRGRSQYEVKQVYIRFCFSRDRHCGCIPQSLRWRVLDPRTGESQAADLGYVVGCTGREAGSGGRIAQNETAIMAGNNRIMIFGPKSDGTYVVEFRTAAGETLAVSIPFKRGGGGPVLSGAHALRPVRAGPAGA
jgi:hypothetical protein